jgi:RimJ/RimL family protein N-acetyltransferase
MDITTERLILHPLTPVEAAHIVARRPDDGDRWHPEYPLEDELHPLCDLAATNSSEVDPAFTLYMVRRREDGLAIGGIGFFGAPDATGQVELGYGRQSLLATGAREGRVHADPARRRVGVLSAGRPASLTCRWGGVAS